MNKRLLIAGLVIIALAGILFHVVNTEPVREPRSIVPFETVSQRVYSGHPERASYIIDNEEEWQGLWQKITGKIIPQPALPEVDFESYMLLAHFMGQRMSGGYGVEFVIVLGVGEKIKVVILEISPGPDCGVTAALTASYHVVQIPRTEKEIEFTIAEATRICSS